MKFAKFRPSAARQVISFMVLNLSQFKPKKEIMVSLAGWIDLNQLI